MAAASERREGPMILLTAGALLLYNLFYWTGKFRLLEGVVRAFYEQVVAHWGLITFLEFLGVASLFADLVIRWDHFQGNSRVIRLVVTGILFAAFITRFLLGVIDIYMIGHVQ